jgi:8-oxo-dGTP pyrophosphatase MutT (NUDIX family)
MKTSCGVLITDGQKLLVCHVTLQPQWDIPKGVMNEFEECKQAAIRECYEETGIQLKPEYLNDLGTFDYLPHKKLHLFLVSMLPLPDTKQMTCSSTFERYGKQLPEVDSYIYCEYRDLQTYTSAKLFPVLKQALKL